MKTAIVACKTLEDELEAARAGAGCDYPVFWLESGLHNYPDRLRTRLQEVLDGCVGFDRVLLAFGFCGNAMAGVAARGFELILPRVDDCISLLLGSPARRAAISHTYFLTRGWLRGERTLWDEYRYAIGKYGEETGREIFAAMLKNYRYLGVIDTGCYSLPEMLDTTEGIAAELGLEQRLLRGTPDYLIALLRGPWPPERFLVFPPASVVAAGDLQLP